MSDRIDYSRFPLLQTERLIILKHYQTCFKHRYYIVDESSGRRLAVSKSDYIAYRRYLDGMGDLPEDLVERLEEAGIEPYSPYVVPTYETDPIARVYLAQRSSGGMYNRMLLISRRKLAGEVEVSMINARPGDPELSRVLENLHSPTVKAIVKDFPVLSGYAKIELDTLKYALEEEGLDDQTIDKVVKAIRNLKDIGGTRAVRELTRYGIVKYEAPAIPKKCLGELLDVDPTALMRDALTPQVDVDRRLFDFYSSLTIRPEGFQGLARYNPHTISLINSGCGRTSMALNLQRAGFAILEDKRTVAGELGFAGIEEARKGVLHEYVGAAVLDEAQEYEAGILKHLMNLVELGEARVTQAGTTLVIRTNATFVLHGNVPVSETTPRRMQLTMFRMLEKMSDNPYAVGRRFPVLFFGWDYKTVRWRADGISSVEHDKAVAMLSEYIRLRQPAINRLFTSREITDWLNRQLPDKYLADIKAIADSVEVPVVPDYVLGQREGYTKLRGLALRLAIRDYLKEIITYDGSKQSKELEAQILESAEGWLNRVLVNNLESLSRLVEGMELTFKEFVESDEALKTLPACYRDLLKMLRFETASAIPVEELVEKRYEEAGCETGKKELKRYFGKRVTLATANKRLRRFGWELTEGPEGRIVMRRF